MNAFYFETYRPAETAISRAYLFYLPFAICILRIFVLFRLRFTCDTLFRPRSTPLHPSMNWFYSVEATFDPVRGRV